MKAACQSDPGSIWFAPKSAMHRALLSIIVIMGIKWVGIMAMNRSLYLRIVSSVSIAAGSVWLGVPAASAATAFQMPMRGNVHVVGNIATVGDHIGRDLWAADLTSDNPAVYPVALGHVVYHGYDCSLPKGSTSNSCYGNVVAIDNGSGYISIYAHLACNDPFFTGLK